ncbi:MAG: MbnP family protein [Prosthecobacter sp.]
MSARAGDTLFHHTRELVVSGFALRRDDGSWLQLSNEAEWMDAATKRGEFKLTNVPPARYTALRFHVGLDAKTNSADPASYAAGHPLNPNLNGLHWSWQGGYIFLAFEGAWRSSDGKPGGFSYHLARDNNRTAITLDGDLDLTSDLSVNIDFELTVLLDGVKPISLAKDGVSTHSHTGDPLAAAIVANLPGAFRIGPANRETTITPPPIRKPSAPIAIPIGPSFPQPTLPTDNPLTPERIALGKQLFNDPALSRDGSLSCASCHPSQTAFADPRRFSLGVDDRAGRRQGMPLFNLAWKTNFFWDGRVSSLRAQALIPIQDPVEMDETLPNVVSKLQKTHASGFKEAFGTPLVTSERIGLAIESYLLTLTSHDSKFDRAMSGKEKLSAEEQRGFELFMMEREPRMGSMGADCFHCHGGALFTDHQFRNNGLPIDPADTGRHRVTGSVLDRGAFATPSLRNIAVTAPYMHDGRFQTLEQVLDHYSEGVQRTDTLDPNLAKHPEGGLHLTAEEKKSVIAFLKTLTDRHFEKAAE